MPASRYYNIVRSMLAVLFLVAGMTAGWIVFTKVLGKPYPEDGSMHAVADEKPKKDTVFVKVVNLGFGASSNSGVPAEKGRAETKTAENNAADSIKKTKRRINEKELPPQTDPDLLPHTAEDISSNTNSAANRTAERENGVAIVGAQKGWHVPAMIAASLLVLLVAFFTKNDELANATLKDIPPAILETLRHELQHEINFFRNPRKILRYNNAVSYHYFFFKQKNLDTPDNIRKMMYLLLAIHRSPALVDTRDVSDESLTEPEWFLEKISKSSQANLNHISMPGDREIVMLVLKLNADMG